MTSTCTIVVIIIITIITITQLLGKWCEVSEQHDVGKSESRFMCPRCRLPSFSHLGPFLPSCCIVCPTWHAMWTLCTRRVLPLHYWYKISPRGSIYGRGCQARVHDAHAGRIAAALCERAAPSVPSCFLQFAGNRQWPRMCFIPAAFVMRANVRLRRTKSNVLTR